LARSIAESTYGRAKMGEIWPKDAVRLYERDPKLRLLGYWHIQNENWAKWKCSHIAFFRKRALREPLKHGIEL